MSLTQSVASAQTLPGLSRPSATLRRSSRRPFTAVASCEKKSVARTLPSAVQQILTAGAASALVLAQPAFADVNLVAHLSESSGPVEQLKGKFFGPQGGQDQRKALDSFTGSNTTGGFDDQGIGRQEDATIDNPNDSPRPKDRSRMGTSESSSDNLNKFAATQANTSDVETQNKS